jgi:hypothetical protein
MGPTTSFRGLMSLTSPRHATGLGCAAPPMHTHFPVPGLMDLQTPRADGIAAPRRPCRLLFFDRLPLTYEGRFFELTPPRR